MNTEEGYLDNISIINIAENDGVLDEVANLLTEVTESGMDTLLEDGLFREIPLLGSAIGILKIYVKAKDFLLQRSIYRFLYHLQEIDENKKQKFIQKLSDDKNFRDRVGENLLLLLNRIDDIGKPELIANLFKAFVEGRIDDVTYQKLSSAVNQFKMQNISPLITFYRGYDGSNFDILHDHASEIADDDLQDLIICGLIDMRFNPNLVIDNGFLNSKVVDLGVLFIKVVLKNEPQ